MEKYLEQMLHMSVTIKENTSLYKQFPLGFKGKYYFYNVNIDGVECFAIQPKGVTGLPQLRRDRLQVEKKSGLNCIIFLDNTTFYAKEKMMEEGIPFVFNDKDIYLPFLGILLSANMQRNLKPIHQISFLTQKILMVGIYESYEKATVTYVSQQLGVSKMAVSKAFDEIEYLGIDVMDSKGKSRAITIQGDKKEIWKEILPYLRSPILKRFELIEDIKLDKKAGISALAEYSMLADNPYPTYAVLKTEIKQSRVKEQKEISRGEVPGCVVLELGYYLDYIKKNVQDPFSVLLSVKDEMDDERVEGSVEEMLEEYVW
ncbi:MULTISPECIES: hypothetical protein [Pseudobutyrivibrio]|uniref:MarR family transcriptional regulator n=1 Tax=Pseudobutyrivibrio xylanivorans TaxID=185007 RepID=A0A1G5RU92_PSEXY|nr:MULTISPECIES: hypothetical protein [Pseudobutyrivibrio]MDC7279587.1 hypothetical protein [Butyrivibrio fibrisolvens]SCZ77497.1 hypothetical protein SAMN02910350_00817 [Pseudobutyrivibrio xylanivorans]